MRHPSAHPTRAGPGLCRLALLVATAMMVVSCGGRAASPGGSTSTRAGSIGTATTTTLPSTPEAAVYLAEAIELMKLHSINRDAVDWDSLETAAFRAAAGAETVADTYPAISLALDRLGDDHSLFLTPDRAADFAYGEAQYVEPVVELGEDGIGYVLVSRYLGDIGEQADEYATDLAARIAEISTSVCGWVLNLQVNGGGNMWPMLGGLAPLLSRGEVGAFTYPDGRREGWFNQGDRVIWGEQVMVTNGAQPGDHDPAPVAVLIGPGTASSGEAVAVAFRGQEGTRFFGKPTSGLTTSNEPVVLDDGAMLILTMSAFTDRTGRLYGQGVPVDPDEPAASPQEAELAAVDWLDTRESCGG